MTIWRIFISVTALATALLQAQQTPCPYDADSRTVLLMHLDETGSFIQDSSGQGNHGTSVGSISTAGLFGLGRQFTQHTYMRVPNATSLQPQSEFTLEAWIKPPTLPVMVGLLPVVLGNFGSVLGGYQMSLSEDGKVFAGMRNVTQSRDVFSTPLPSNTWSHVAITYKQAGPDAIISIFINGQLNKLETLTNFQIAYAGIPDLHIGESYDGLYFGGDRWFPGVVDEIRISDVVRESSELGCGTLRVDIDIKPGSYPNSINLGSGGSVPVAILGSTTFDATTVDPATVTLASAPVKMKGKSTLAASFQDVNGDGRVDLVVHVETSALELSAGDTEAWVEGKTLAGRAFKGRDTVRIVPSINP